MLHMLQVITVHRVPVIEPFEITTEHIPQFCFDKVTCAQQLWQHWELPPGILRINHVHGQVWICRGKQLC